MYFRISQDKLSQMINIAGKGISCVGKRNTTVRLNPLPLSGIIVLR